MSTYFFFPAALDFLREEGPLPSLARYRYLLPATAVLLAGAFLYLRKSAQKPYRFTLFLNTLLLILVVIDTASLIYKSANPRPYLLTVSDPPLQIVPACDTCEKPDIFLLIMDEYAASLSLRQQYGFSNDLDSFLLRQQFSIQDKSRSNYNYTDFCMTSIFNMGYIRGIKDVNTVEQMAFGKCRRLIRNNEAVRILKNLGYRIVNYSGFDMDDQAGDPQQPILPEGTFLINYRTLFPRLGREKKEILKAWADVQPPSGFSTQTFRISNAKFEQLVCKNAARQEKPRFVYAHFVMPHYPFYFDRHGKLKSGYNYVKEATLEMSQKKFVSEYLEYVTYTNSKIKKMIATIRRKNPGAVILLMGDHGFRTSIAPMRSFDNLNAVYYPDHDYRLLYDSISGVNQFRVVFNKLFDLKLPLLKDSSVFIVTLH